MSPVEIFADLYIYGLSLTNSSNSKLYFMMLTTNKGELIRLYDITFVLKTP
jgi:hypothetical protein